MTITPLVGRRFIGVSTDVKPTTHETGVALTSGWTFEETDTGRNYEWDGSVWIQKSLKADAKNFFKTKNSSFIQLFGDEFSSLPADTLYLLEDLTDEQGGTSLTNNGSIDLTRREDELPLRGHLVPTFNGTDQYFSIPTEAKVEVGTNSFIAKIDFKRDGNPTVDQERMVSYGDTDGEWWDISMNTSGKIVVDIDDGTTLTNILSTQTKWSDNKWHTAILFFNKTFSANGTLFLFVDGELLGQTNVSVATGTLNNADENLNIGALSLVGSVDRHWTGELSNFQLYIDADPNKLFPMIPILSNPQLRESGSKGTQSWVTGNQTTRMNTVFSWSGDTNYTSTIIYTSEGFYDVSILHRTASSFGIQEFYIDGVLLKTNDMYSGSTVNSVVTPIITNYFLGGGSHVIKLVTNDNNVTSSGFANEFSMIELIKREGTYNEDDEATSVTLFGDEFEIDSDGTSSLDIDANSVFNTSWTRSGGNADDGDFNEATLFLKKGKYNVSMTHLLSTDHGILDLWVGGVKVYDQYDMFRPAGALRTQRLTKEVFVEGGKTVIKLQVNGKNPTSTDFRFNIQEIRIELSDGKGDGDIVNMWANDPNELLTGQVPTIVGIVSGGVQRFNFQQLESAGNKDESLWRRYFSGGTYLVKLLHRSATNSAIIDVFTDDNKATPDIFSNLDTYNVSPENNLENFTVMNIPRGFHEIHFFNDGKNASSTAFFNIWTRMTFTKIGESIDAENDNNQDTIINSGHVKTDQGTIEVNAI